MKQETLLKANNTHQIQVINGVTYFKLQSEINGDVTKNCGLLGEEVDRNFYFLRGYDIESVEVDEFGNLIIKRVDPDYEPIIVPLEYAHPKYSFNQETGTLTITYADNTFDEVEGFILDASSVRIVTDSTLDGKGVMTDPLKLSVVEHTGVYSPVEELIDFTIDDEIDVRTKGSGYRVLTKEYTDIYGCLYPFSAVEKIDQALKDANSPWRVATKNDWDEMLNAFECSEYRNHQSMSSGVFGNKAGVALKSSGTFDTNDGLWKASSFEDCGNNTSEMSIYPILGKGTIASLDKLGQYGAYWTATVTENGGEAYAKTFLYNNGGVQTDTLLFDKYCGIRLVKDASTDDSNHFETILGLNYPTKLVTSIHDDYNYAKVWTTINFYDTSEDLQGKVCHLSDEYPIIYCINEWDGLNWHKKIMNEGDSVVIKNDNYSEYRLINGKLVNVLMQVSDIDSDMTELNSKLDTFSANVINNFTIIEKNINSNSATIETILDEISDINDINNVVENLSAYTIENVKALNDDLKDLTESTTTSLNEHETLITNLQKTLNNVSASTVTNFNNGIILNGDTVSLKIKNGEKYIEVDNDGLSTKGIDELFNESKEYAKALASSISFTSKDITINTNPTGNNLSLNLDNITIGRKTSENGEFNKLTTLLEIKDVTNEYNNPNIKSVYRLVDGNGFGVGDDIVIYKDGNTLTFSAGLLNTNGVVTAKRDTDSENYLQISDKGISVNGIKNDIDDVKNEVIQHTNNQVANINELITELRGHDTEIEKRLSIDEGKIDNNTTSITKLSIDIPTNYVTKDELSNNISQLSNNQIVAVKYDSDSKQIFLKKANGEDLMGFDASMFLKDSVLDSVRFDNVRNELVFKWNDEDHTETSIPLDKLSDVYTISGNSNTYLGIDNLTNEIYAIVDGDKGYVKTLASTEFVTDKVDEGVENAAKYTDLVVGTTSASLISYIDNADFRLGLSISGNTKNIEILNSNVETPGSVLHSIDDSLIQGLPINTITFADLDRRSLIHAVVVGNERKYFVPNTATEMLYKINADTYVNLNDYIAELQSTITQMDNKIQYLENTLQQTIKDVIDGYLFGTDKEIKINKTENKLQIGFADDAIFGPE